MNAKNRIDRLERKRAGASRVDEFWARYSAEQAAARAAFLDLVPQVRRDAVRAVLEGPDSHLQHDLTELQCHPFARWAPPRPPGYQLPGALITCLLDAGVQKVMTSHCGRCGLSLPILFRSSLDPNPPVDLVIFRTCPDEGCGGPTGWYGYAPADPGGASLPV